jgi:hypothetical protein
MRYTLNKAEIELSGYELFPNNFPEVPEEVL